MKSLRTALNTAADRRQLPAYPAGDIGALTKALKLAPPVSLTSGLLPALNNLPFATVTMSSGPLTANFVHGSAQVGMQSNGNVSFRYHVEEAGVTGDNFLFTATLNGVVDNTGATLVFVHQGNVAGTLNIGGSTTADFQLDTMDQAIADLWDTAKNASVKFTLHAQTDPFQLTEGLLGGFLLVIVYKILQGINTSNCEWSGDSESGELAQCTDSSSA